MPSTRRQIAGRTAIHDGDFIRQNGLLTELVPPARKGVRLVEPGGDEGRVS